MKRIVSAAVQFSVEPMCVELNLNRAYKLISECCKASKPDLIVLPESFTTGFTPMGSTEDLWKAVDFMPGKLTDIGLKWAREFNTHIVFPSYERGKKDGIVYNSAALLAPDGLIGVYRKTHPFPTERLQGGGWTTPGNRPCCLETPFGRVGIVICYDGDFPELARVTTLRG
ncbi:MAG: carbon-nitrogen hydrolase family protein, partial [Candidatus Ozemobacteraceae bacterium]